MESKDLSRQDLEALAASESLRTALSDQLACGGADVLSLGLHLGRLYALSGASALLVTTTVEELAPQNLLVKAALLEGFARGREELCRNQFLDRLASPIVELETGSDAYSVYCAYETDDDVDLGEWADGIVRALRKRGARRIFTAGSDLAAAKVREAANLVGIATTTPAIPAPVEPPSWRRFWPFRGGQGKE